jgi:F-type H+-transporting ATPase subunit b
MSIDWWTLGLQAINALVLVWILARYLFRPVSAIIAERKDAAQAELRRAAKAMEKAEAAKSAADAERAAFARELSDLQEKARYEAEEIKRQMRLSAEQEAAQIRQDAAKAVDQMQKDARHQMGEEAATLAVQIARKLLTRLPQEAQVSEFSTGLAEALAALPDATRSRIGAKGPVAVRAPRALTQEETAKLRGDISGALGRDVQVAITVDPSLIAGFELDAQTATVRNHLAADLMQIKEELVRHA